VRSYQHGVGLVEVLVALVLLAIAILGFTALQLRAIAASNEAGQNVQAMNIARDLSERIRVNREGLLDYKEVASPKTCANETDAIFCTATEMAEYDFKQVSNKANNLGMQLAIRNCQGSTGLKRKCIYVAWEGTTPTNGSDSPHCTNGVAYLPQAKCVIVEVYNYDD
jgi:type IV pilus assembly protein PilV